MGLRRTGQVLLGVSRARLCSGPAGVVVDQEAFAEDLLPPKTLSHKWSIVRVLRRAFRRLLRDFARNARPCRDSSALSGWTRCGSRTLPALPEPSRDVCLQAAQSSDVYLLLLGDHYGTPFPDTGLSPIHEEYRAALNSGIPVLAFRRRDVAMEPTQVQFAEEVEAYQTGLFRGSWDEVGQLLNAVSGALSNLDALAGRLVFTPDWRSRGRQLADADRRPRPVQWVRPVRTRGVPHAAEHDDARLATAEGW